jgi:hypothetical protein
MASSLVLVRHLAAAAIAVGSSAGGGRPVASVVASAEARAPGLYDFRIERGWLRMPDGVQLAVTYFRPVPRTPN